MSVAPKFPSCDMPLEELLLHALVMEREAVKRYMQLADMMEQVGNSDVATIFAQLSKNEAKHAARIEEQIGDCVLPILTPSEYRWRGTESPENADTSCLFHLMKPRQAISLALQCERDAHEFFADVVTDSTDERVREIAAEFAAEEKQHVTWVEKWLTDL